MSIVDLPVFNLLKEKLNWHQTRQTLLAENVANADTPGFKPLDLAPLDPSDKGGGIRGVGMLATNRAHIVASMSGTGPFKEQTAASWETSPSANAVVLEEQMMKVTENQMDYQMATALYSRGLALLKTAIRSA
ncbi:Flagellar basal-body rod protein FlgB [hydrothermal vent metagenome]|uniref:Flagellar basal-body rod protein FlgB n=1 Tax=hydrothermal vent metagenome TaxID=652676 RepID=A0A3B0T0E7_9ZZZZ